MNLNALTRDHVNNFWDTSTPICQTGKSGRHLHWAQCWIDDQLDICGLLRPEVHLTILIYTIDCIIKLIQLKKQTHTYIFIRVQCTPHSVHCTVYTANAYKERKLYQNIIC